MKGGLLNWFSRLIDSANLMAEISFFSDNVTFELSNQEGVRKWLFDLSSEEGFVIDNLNVVFVSDEKLLEMNVQFLGHDYYTDIITFPVESKKISGELYISAERVRENAAKENIDFLEETHRVIAHGLLHLLGYNDKSEVEIAIMREREVFYLNLRSF